MQTVDVLRPLALGKLALGPRELEVDVGVESLLRPRHRAKFGGAETIPGSAAATDPAGAAPNRR